MNTKEEVNQALQVIISIIQRCEKAQMKFKEGSSQHSLLKNRLYAMYIAKDLLEQNHIHYSKEALTSALRPIRSIIHKCETAQMKHEEGNASYKRLQSMLKAMYISELNIMEKLDNIT